MEINASEDYLLTTIGLTEPDQPNLPGKKEITVTPDHSTHLDEITSTITSAEKKDFDVQYPFHIMFTIIQDLHDPVEILRFLQRDLYLVGQRFLHLKRPLKEKQIILQLIDTGFWN